LSDLATLRSSLLSEARSSPALLADIAGLEQYISESYSARSLVELLQNADDCRSKRFTIVRAGNDIIAANDGVQFSIQDLEALCRSAASTKVKGKAIGYRGIGFKSVVGLCSEVYLLSGDFAVQFSRERTLADVPEATRAPLLRIPHAVDPSRIPHFASISSLLAKGYSTAFVLSNVSDTSLDREFDDFDPTALLFLRFLEVIESPSFPNFNYSVKRSGNSNNRTRLKLSGEVDHDTWEILDCGAVQLGFAINSGSAVRLDERNAVAHVFLPTHDDTGFSIKVNAEFSTDPSRTRILFDDNTKSTLSQLADSILELIESGVAGIHRIPVEFYAALAPTIDPQLSRMQRPSFRRALFSALVERACGRFGTVRLSPPWFRDPDFSVVAKNASLKLSSPDITDIEGLRDLLRFLGAREATYGELALGIGRSALSVLGAADLVSYLAIQVSVRSIMADAIDPSWAIWKVENRLIETANLASAQGPLDDDFVSLIVERTGDPVVLRNLLKQLVGEDTGGRLLHESGIKPTLPPLHFTTQTQVEAGPTLPSLVKWRSAEEVTLQIFRSMNWKVIDVSRQLVGYDIHATKENGDELFIEVKKLDNLGDPFSLTTNEEATARVRGSSYVIALIVQRERGIEMALLIDPSNTVRLERQCRQWAWECSSYVVPRPQFYSFSK
jgi:hypothetical protein